MGNKGIRDFYIIIFCFVFERNLLGLWKLFINNKISKKTKKLYRIFTVKNKKSCVNKVKKFYIKQNNYFNLCEKLKFKF